jgi:hypothetical protein
MTPGLVPVRGVVAPQRRAHADPLAGHRALPIRRLLHEGLTDGRRRPALTRWPNRSTGATPRAGRTPTSSRSTTATGCSSTATSSSPPRSSGSPRSTPPPRSRSPRSLADEGRRPGGVAARKAFGDWSKLAPGAERAKYLFRIARLVQERSRELAVLETRDGGKPIRESRDVDLPLVAAHFFYTPDGPTSSSTPFPASMPKPLGVAGQVIPWNFPLLMLAWKVAPGPRRRQHGGAQAGRDHAAVGTPLSPDLRRSRAAPGVFNVVTGCRGDRCGGGRSRRRRQGGLHRLDRGRQDHPAPARRIRQEAHPRAGGQGSARRLRRRPARSGGRGVINGIFFNQGHVCCAGSR